MATQELVWLAADYHFPTTYSCRVPMSSASSALAMPAPGPATVRLAMVRSGLELFGEDFAREELFPIIRSAEVYIKPPAKVAMSTQLLHVYKVNRSKRLSSNPLIDSLMYREVCHAEGEMTIYIRIPIAYEDVCRETLATIGYWGQANSLAWCVAITHKSPQIEDCGRSLKNLVTSQSTRNIFCCIVADFRDKEVKWDEIVPVVRVKETTAIQLEVWVWPLMIIEQRSNHKLLVRYSLVQAKNGDLQPRDYLLSRHPSE